MSKMTDYASKMTNVETALGFYDFSKGKYLLFGKDTQKPDKQMIRSMIAYVDQSCFLFSMSVADNVRLGRLGATNEEIETAAYRAGACFYVSHRAAWEECADKVYRLRGRRFE